MTLDTDVWLDGPIHGREAFRLGLMSLLEAAGRLSELDGVQTEETPEGTPYRFLGGAHAQDMIQTVRGQNLPGIVTTYYREDGSPLHTEDAEDEGFIVQRACQVQLSWDTAYGYHDAFNATPARLHAHALLLLSLKLPEGVTMRWRNEFSGEVHTDTNEEDLKSFCDDGAAIDAYFVSTLVPLLNSLSQGSK